MPFDPLKSQQLTDASTVAKVFTAHTVPGMAHFAGTGPADKTCGDCASWVMIPRSPKMQCARYTKMTGQKGKAIPHSTWACRYFEQRR